MWGVNVNDKEDAARAMIAEKGLKYPNLRDPNGQTLGAYNIRGIPTIAVIDPAGNLRYQGYNLPVMDEVLSLAGGGRGGDTQTAAELQASADQAAAARQVRQAKDRQLLQGLGVMLAMAMGVLLWATLGGKRRRRAT